MNPNSQKATEHPVFTRREEKHLQRLQARINILGERLKSAIGSAALDATLEISAIGWAMDTVKILLTEARAEQSGPAEPYGWYDMNEGTFWIKKENALMNGALESELIALYATDGSGNG